MIFNVWFHWWCMWLHDLILVVSCSSFHSLHLDTRHEPSIRSFHSHHHLHAMYEHARHYQQHRRKRPPMVISDMDTVNFCDRPLVKLFRSYCCEWNCHSQLFQTFQVSHCLRNWKSERCSSIESCGHFHSRCLCRSVHHHLHRFEHVIHGLGSTRTKW